MKTIKKLFGGKKALKESLIVAFAMLAVTIIYEYAALIFVPDFEVNYYEFFGTWFVLNAVWLVRTQNIQNWAWGIVGVLILGFFFKDIGLPGQQWLQWAFFIPVQIWSWYYWMQGGNREGDLPVTTLTNTGRLLWFSIIAAGTVVVFFFIDVFSPGSLFPWVDSLVVVASMTAQYLMGKKKVESWILWLGPVNILSITLFYLAGAYVLTALYIAFFIHAVFGARDWWRLRT